MKKKNSWGVPFLIGSFISLILVYALTDSGILKENGNENFLLRFAVFIGPILGSYLVYYFIESRKKAN